MKNKNNLMVILTALLTLSACSSAPKTQTAATDEFNLDALLSDRAIAQATAGGELLVKLIGAATSNSEKQALVRLIEKTAQNQGIASVKGMSLTAQNVGVAYSEEQAAKIVKAIAQSQSKLFARPALKQLSGEADVALARASTERAAGTQKLASNIDLSDKQTLAAVRNLYVGFKKNKAFVNKLLNIKNKTNVMIWTDATCNTFGKLDEVAAGNLLKLGEGQEQVANSIAAAGLVGEKATACMIKKGSVQALNDVVTLLKNPASQALNTLEMAVKPCNLLPEQYPAAAKALVAANNGRIPAVSEVQCN